MSFMKITEELLNKTLTENGDLAFRSSLSPCLDFFALVGGKREDLKGLSSLFIRAYCEDRATALKILFYTRDIRGGLGERKITRFLLNYLANISPKVVEQMIPLIPEYGRFDDLFVLLGTEAENALLDYLQKQLSEDLLNKKAGKSISLLGKWMPSINTSNEEARQTALYLANRLNMTNAEYRKTLSFLRKGMIIENNLRVKQYDFDYATVPGGAMSKYNEAFGRNDGERFALYLSRVKSGVSKMNVDTMDVVHLVKRVVFADTKEKENFFETAWNKIVGDTNLDRRTLVVRDGSGSMTVGDSYTSPLEVANAMTLLTAERLSGEFHNKFITFSKYPELVDLTDCKTLREKALKLRSYADYENTDIQKVYEVVLDVYRNPNFKPEDAIEQLMIVSDMEFDHLTVYEEQEKGFNKIPMKSTFEYFDEEFKKLGYKRPEVIFWNVAARDNHLPVKKDENGCKLVSGSSKNVIDLVVLDKSLSPLTFMNKVLERYSFVDDLDLEV